MIWEDSKIKHFSPYIIDSHRAVTYLSLTFSSMNVRRIPFPWIGMVMVMVMVFLQPN
jgi:hypothetical protein